MNNCIEVITLGIVFSIIVIGTALCIHGVTTMAIV